MTDILVIGGCIVDLISYVDRFPRPGETMAGKHFSKGFGGKAANQCVMAMKLGATTGMIAKLGDDSFGHEYLQHIRESGINCDHVTLTKLGHTSTASISVTDEGQNSIIYVPGAIMHLTSSDILTAEEMIMRSKLMLCTYECPLDSLFTALTVAKKHNVKTIVNAAPATDSSYEKLYSLIDIICLNEVEAEEATKLPMRSLEDASLVINSLMEKGCSVVILTLGAKGAIFQTKSQANYIYVPAKAVKAVDSTGAGDAFMGSLVYYLVQFPNMNLETAIKRSCDIATLSVLKKGTQTSFPSKEELPEELFS